jgi:ComF family protein
LQHTASIPSWPGNLLAHLLPQSCLLCGADSGTAALCAPCHQDLPWLPLGRCPVCALPTPQGNVCGQCLKAPPAFDTTIAAWAYQWPLDRLIPAWKYRNELTLTTPLGDGLLRAATLAADRPAMLIPMPLHPTRQRERGFNQSHELARMLGRRLGLPVAPAVVERTRLTPPQASLPWDQRQKAIRNAFRVCGEVVGQHIALVDDVMTTGASLHELAKALKTAGAQRVDCWVLARTPKD